MIVLIATLVFKGKDLVAPPQSKINAAMREGGRSMGWYWWRNYLPFHFRLGNRERYGLTPRSPKYDAMKARRGLPDLISPRKSGGPKGPKAVVITLGSRPNKVEAIATASRQRVRVVVPIPGYLKLKKLGGRPLSQEVVLRNPEEDLKLFEVFKRSVFNTLFKKHLPMPPP